MNAPTRHTTSIKAMHRQIGLVRLPSDGIAFTETREGYWTVSADGDEHDTRSITKDGASFIAWVGFADRHWCFARALRTCAEDIRFRREMAAESLRAHEQAIASLMRMTPAEKDRLIAKLEQERDALDYAPSHVDVVARKAVFDRQIARLREIV